ncbi:MAG: polyribonucleotide nucleotidyltransferase [Nitrospirae bacterium CG_4_9_14_3_um_filter_53_35]|nr:MAG: polyribonucleotide nucleotidyltransferase [Nitrospirae bacterium CG2_30_53_67]PIS38046.1 MAG: polyribonucleotide nucleotidyltransferase [Nitrospirae bacterium CG08_land_8_20_14_0_20_52_24]PIW85273.1 MAG: polyribonucleotide nucleotidyltransferase [Nitrospirae bacterium CG_4_8_14_3_um_filter_50_41]PIX86548.1 MAG: polyribonucleotide nucleotidyltransferase [Nitrospirae bacterium CG_4_10_14_3_um_filter_53_41]PJA76648.1 MAG: polyribonucleotide nucleotidyltransferase [Nitrospirae bacterium CG_
MIHKLETMVGGRLLSIETGNVAKQASGAVMARYGDTMVLVTAVSDHNERQGVDFLPLTIQYQEKFYAAGKIPGGFFKREGRPTEFETLSSRLIDRPLRPLFPKNYFFETQVIATVLSADQQNYPDTIALIGASAALAISDVPFKGPVGGVRVGRINGEFVINPTYSRMADSELNLIVAGTREAVTMVEAGARELPEEVMAEAIEFGHREIIRIVEIQEELQRRVNPVKRVLETPVPDEAGKQLEAEIRSAAAEMIRSVNATPGKHARQKELDDVLQEMIKRFDDETGSKKAFISGVCSEIEREDLRRLIIQEKKRVDGRSFNEVRPISCRVGFLPRTHGSALFTRGETQSIVVTTLGTSSDEQRIDALEGESTKRFMLHYNFPPYSVGEAKMLRGPGRREVGHGALAERALTPVIPDEEKFPYTIRIVSEITESNGSSSMATVCGGTLSLMDAGVPIASPVSGIAMGLIKEGDDVIILSDILGAEDHFGDMDFKVTGTEKGVTALQMDIKISGVDREIMSRALAQAREGRIFILKKMLEALPVPRENISVLAPRIVTIKIHPDKIREVIGPGGKMIRSIVEQTGAKIDIEDDGTVKIASADSEACENAIKIIRDLTQEAQVGKIYLGTVRKIMDFGAFVEIFPGTDGLVHISQLADFRVNRVEDVLKEGDQTLVKVLEIDRQGKIRLSRKEAMPEKEKKK